MRFAADSPPSLMNRRMVIVTCVLLLHIGLLWALQSGLMRRAVEVIVPVEVLSEFLTPAAPSAKPAPAPKTTVQPAEPQVRPQPAPLPLPASIAQEAAPAPALVSPAPPVEAVAVAVAPPASPGPPKIELPSSEAAYLNNPRPAYPALSRRLGEQGKVIVRVLIGIDGRAQQVEIKRSSGFERLDQAALATVRSWRYVPGTRNGVPEAMWYDAPINFILE